MLILVLIPLVSAHSWLHCIDYRGSLKEFENDKCFAWPRLMKAGPFGVDQGMNYRPSNDIACKSSNAEPHLFKPGQVIRLTWPAKNHVAASCTNPYIPKGNLGVYQHRVQNWNDVERPWKDWVADENRIATLTFQNCPYFCDNMDKAICAGNLTLPKESGKYKMNWIWMFNTGEWYTHCFDVEIEKNAESARPTMLPTRSLKPSLQSCIPLWKNCQNAPCCSGLMCEKKNQYYSQCIPVPQSRYQCESCRACT